MQNRSPNAEFFVTTLEDENDLNATAEAPGDEGLS